MAGEAKRLRKHVAHRAKNRCEYCGLHEDYTGFVHQVDHVIALKHGGGGDLNNLALACAVCNRNKGSNVASWDLAKDEPIRLFNPRKEKWADHFRLDGYKITPLTPVGEATARVLELNSDQRVVEREMLGPGGRLRPPSRQ